MPILVFKNGRLSRSESSAQYCGDKIGGEFRSWDTISTDPNEFIRESYGVLSDRNATLYQTSPHARACINKPLSYVIGDGIAFKSAINADFVGWTAQRAKEWSKRFSLLLHLDTLYDGWYKKQAIVFREASKCGDCIIYFLREEGREAPLELLVAPGQAIDWRHSTDRTEETPGDRWVLGILLDKYSRRKAFWQKSTRSRFNFKDENGNVDAIQFMFQESAGQARGYGQIHSAIALVKQFDRFIDSTVARSVIESIMLGYYNVDKTDVGRQMRQIADMSMGNATPSTQVIQASTTVKSNDMPVGAMMELQNRESMTFNDLKTPSDNFDAFNKWAMRWLAMARGYPPEFLLGEYSTSFTAHKGALNDADKKSLQERGQFAATVEKPINKAYLRHYALTGQIDVPPSFWTDYRMGEALLQGTYLGPVPGHINPLQEVKADVEAVKASFNDHEAVARKYGREWDDTIDEWEEQQTRWAQGSAEMKAQAMATQEQANAEIERVNAEKERDDERDDKGTDDEDN